MRSLGFKSDVHRILSVFLSMARCFDFFMTSMIPTELLHPFPAALAAGKFWLWLENGNGSAQLSLFLPKPENRRFIQHGSREAVHVGSYRPVNHKRRIDVATQAFSPHFDSPAITSALKVRSFESTRKPLPSL